MAQLTGHDQQGKGYTLVFSYADGSKKANSINGTQGDDTMLQTEIGVRDEDLEVIKNPMATSNDLQEHLAFMIAQKRRNVEVSLRNCNAYERREFEAAKTKKPIDGYHIQSSRSFEEPEYLSKELWP